MKNLKSGNWKVQVLWIVVAIALSLIPGSPEEVFAFIRYRDKYCSEDTSESTYCNFSVLRTLEGHPTASAIVISADGQTLISGGQDKTIKIWELQTGELKKTLRSDSGAINALAIAPDGKTVVTGSGDRIVRIWDLTSDRPPQILKGHSGRVTNVDISSDGKTIISVDHGMEAEIKVWDMATGKQKAALPSFYFDDISLDGKTVIFTSGNNNKLIAWDVATNQQQVLQKSFHPWRLVRISLDGQRLVSTKRTGKRSFEVQVSDLKTGQITAKERFNRRIFKPSSIALSRDVLIGNTKKWLTVWNLQTAEIEAILDEQQIKQMNNLVVSPDGKILAGIITDSNSSNRKIQVLQRP
ncbi:WD40 repeat domain-containing protein [Anabaena sp. CCY 0017]|uniref:WD40 repeat domain-containing protein n=1 Tax=Anabaena sp. CCY 0017 TaxID=3103866 RepID=UPI0039C6B884